MTKVMSKAREKAALKNLKQVLSANFAAPGQERTVGVSGEGLVSINGQLFPSNAEYGTGMATVVNTGRLASAMYTAGDGAGGAVVRAASTVVSGGGGGGGGTVVAHALAVSGGVHTGTLPWTDVSKSGSALADLASRPHSSLTGIGANDHHNQATAGNAEITVSGAQVITLAAHDIFARHSVSGGANFDIVGQSGAGVLARLTPSANVSSGIERILKSDANGYVTVKRAIGSERVQTPLVEATAGDLDLNASSNRVRLLSSSRLQSFHYASQTTGWGVTYDGSADFRYVYTDELHAKAFIADLEQALAGGQIISKSVAMLHLTFTAPAAGGTTFLYVRDLPSAPAMQVFQNYDMVRLRNFSRSGGSLTIADCWGVVRSDIGGAEYQWTEIENGHGYQRWHFTRSSAPNAGAMSTGATVLPDALVLDYGTTGNGFYEVNAIDGANAVNSPYAQIVTWDTHPHSGKTVRARMGNLVGITGTTEYGLYAGKSPTEFIKVSDVTVEMRKVPVNMYNGSDLTGRWLATGDFALSPTDASTDASRTFSFVASTGALRLGQLGSGKPNLYWDGTDLKIRQNATDVIVLAGAGTSYFSDTMTIGSASNLQLIPGAANTARVQVGTSSNVAGINAVSGSSDISFWAGAAHSSRASAPFRVTAAGAMVATSGTIGGVTIDGSNGIAAGSGSSTVGMVGTSSGSHLTILWGGATFANRNTAPFRVTNLGHAHVRNIVASVSGDPLEVYDYSDGLVTGSLLVAFNRLTSDRSVVGVGAQSNKMLVQRVDGTNGLGIISNQGTGNLEVFTNGARAAAFTSTGDFSTYDSSGNVLSRVHYASNGGTLRSRKRIGAVGATVVYTAAMAPEQAQNVANGSSIELETNLYGLLVVIDQTGTQTAMFLLRGLNAPVLVAQNSATTQFTTTYGTASKINLGINAGALWLQNNSGGARTFHFNLLTHNAY